jgi:hypothetical protein
MDLRTVLLLAAAPLLAAQGGGGYGGAGAIVAPCSSDVEYQRLLEQVATNCCTQFGQTENCANGFPSVCDTRCATVFLAFYEACDDYLSRSVDQVIVRQQMVATRGRCHATVQANEVHDTDLVAPGEQHDMNTKLSVPVNCHNVRMTTAGELNDNTG